MKPKTIKTLNRPKAPTAGKLDLAGFLASGCHPYSAEINLGNGEKLAVTFRAYDADRIKAAVLAEVGADLVALGFDPETLLASMGGQMPKGQAKEDLKAALDALGDNDAKALGAIMKRVNGAGIASVLGSWGFGDEITPAVCASLPPDLQQTILNLSQSAVLPVERLDFLGK